MGKMQPERRPAGIKYAEGMEPPDKKDAPRVKGLSLFPRPGPLRPSNPSTIERAPSTSESFDN